MKQFSIPSANQEKEILLGIICTKIPKIKLTKPNDFCFFKVSIQDLTGQDIKLLLSVVRAYDVPIRSDPDPLASHADGPKEALVHSYIEARFQVELKFDFNVLSHAG